MLSSRTNAGVVLLLVTAQVFAGVVLFETRRGLAGVRVELAENTRRTLRVDDTPPLGCALASDVEALKVDRDAVFRRLGTLEQKLEMTGAMAVPREVTFVREENGHAAGKIDEHRNAQGTHELVTENNTKKEDLERRRAQAEGDHLHHTNDVHANNAQIITRSVQTRLVPGAGGHRRAQTACSTADVHARTDLITAECCDEPDEDCTGGYPHTCNVGCANVFLPFWTDCHSALGEDSAQFESTVALCEAAAGPPTGTSLVQQLNLQCTDETLSDSECIPECAENVHGYLMLLNIQGEDSKLSCELHRGLYSWVGAATDGGYLGSDIETFIPAVISGAAGSYNVIQTEPAMMTTDLVIQPGQTVRISGGLPSPVPWGRGDMVVNGRGSLALAMLRLSGAVSVLAGGIGTLHGCAFDAPASLLTAGSLSLISMDVPAALLAAAEAGVTDAGTLHLVDVTVPDTAANLLTGTVSVGADGIYDIEPETLFDAVLGTGGWFAVKSGGTCQKISSNGAACEEYDGIPPCTISDGGRCVGRPGGYMPWERCEIAVFGRSAMIEGCSVFDLSHYYAQESDGLRSIDAVTLPNRDDPSCCSDNKNGLLFSGGNCPIGQELQHGDVLGWQSDHNWQGTGGLGNDGDTVSCDSSFICGLEASDNGLGGGWQICFPDTRAKPCAETCGPHGEPAAGATDSSCTCICSAPYTGDAHCTFAAAYYVAGASDRNHEYDKQYPNLGSLNGKYELVVGQSCNNRPVYQKDGNTGWVLFSINAAQPATNTDVNQAEQGARVLPDAGPGLTVTWMIGPPPRAHDCAPDGVAREASLACANDPAGCRKEPTCWEGNTETFPSCSGYETVGYTCVGGHCASMAPGGTPSECAVPTAGCSVDAATGRCIACTAEDEFQYFTTDIQGLYQYFWTEALATGDGWETLQCVGCSMSGIRVTAHEVSVPPPAPPTPPTSTCESSGLTTCADGSTCGKDDCDCEYLLGGGEQSCTICCSRWLLQRGCIVCDSRSLLSSYYFGDELDMAVHCNKPPFIAPPQQGVDSNCFAGCETCNDCLESQSGRAPCTCDRSC
jgi:hypothetical protein